VRILVTGFTPFGRGRTNPSEWIARRLEVPGVVLVRGVLPTTYRGSEKALLRLLRRHRPDAVLSLGLSSSSSRLRLEMVALNVDHAEVPDNSGERRERRKIRSHGTWVRESRLPIEEILDAWKRARVPGAVSYHAGTYVCNHLFYCLLGATEVPAGFVHVPSFRKMKSAKILEGIRAAIIAIARGRTRRPRARWRSHPA